MITDIMKRVIKMADIVAIGELIVDFTETAPDGVSPAYRQSAGGAPANVVCMAGKLGASAGFIGKTGRDMFGFYLKDVLKEHKVDTSGLILDPNYYTAIAFVRKDEEGGRIYHFYRNSSISADINLRYGEVDRSLIDECRIFHFGAVSLAAEPSRTAAVNSAEYAKMQGKIISYAPDWRPHLWENKETALQTMRSAVQYADIICVSEAELQLITDCGTLIASAAKLLNSGVKVICVTQGAKGCVIATSKGIERYPSYPVKTVDTLGAGDSFLGAFLYKLIQSGKELDELDPDAIKEMAMFANACGALSGAKEGAIPSMPELSEIEELMKKETVK